MVCLVMTSILGTLTTILLYLRYIFFSDFSKIIKLFGFLIFIFIGCLPLFTDYKFEKYFGFLYPIYRYIMFFIFIMAIMLFTITIIRDIVWLVSFLFNKNLTNPFISALLPKINNITLIISFIISCFALYSGLKVPKIKNIEIRSEKILKDKKIVLLSDLHLHRVLSKKKLEGTVKKVNNIDSDAILIIGDTIDDETDRIKDHLKILKGLKSKNIYFVAGNHENYIGHNESIKALKDLGFTFLENNGKLMDTDLYIGGIPDIFSGNKYDLEKTFKEANPKNYKILMSHTPANFKDKNFDLEVAGHTHGGQIFPFVLFVYLSSPYVAGFYNLDENTKLYVSRGSGQWGPQMRFFAPSEITVLSLKNKI